jgi:DNA repair protein RadD
VSAPALRPYQATLIADVRAELRTHKRVVLQAPTGSGKTVLTAHMIREAARRGRSAWFMVHRNELLEQTSKALYYSDVPHGRIAAGCSMTKDPVQVASVQTLVRRLDRVDPPDLIVVDEAHHTVASSYRAILDHCPNAYVVGLTATPIRTDGTGLGDLFSGLVLGPSVQDLIAQGYLAPYRIVAPPSKVDLTGVHRRGGDYVRGELEAVVDRATIMGDAVEHYQKHVQRKANGRPPTCLTYCVSRQHAKHVEAAYRQAGVDARYCAGDTPKAERDAIVAGFRVGVPPVIVSVDLFGEGLDVPGLFAVQLLRPTVSLTLHLQQIGRALRPETGKDYALVLDHVGNTWKHGLPDDDRDWSLEGEARRKKKATDETAPGIRICDKCFAVYRITLPACPVCGAVPEIKGRGGPEQVDGELEELDPEIHRQRRMRRIEEGRADTLEALVSLALERGYKPGWAGIKYAVRHGSNRTAAIRQANRIARSMK